MSVSVTANIEGGFYPPSAFYFKVIIGMGIVGPDTSFQDVSGISSEMGVEEVTEGGENGFVHKLPKGVKHTNLELKRGIANMASPLVLWCKSVFEGGLNSTIITQPVSVFLLNEYAIPLRAWTFENAFPIKWEVESFNSTKNEVAIEKITLSYNTSKRLI